MIKNRIPANRLFASLSLITALAASVSTGTAQNLGAASGYSYFVFGDVSQSNANSKGAAAIGGNASLSNYALGEQLPSSSVYSLVVGGDLTINGATINKGSALYGGTSSLTGVNFINGTSSQGSLIDFSAAKTQFGNLSDTLVSQGANSNYSLAWGNLVFTGTDAALNSFTISASDFNSASSVAINAPTGSTVVINVTGDLINFTNRNVSLNGIDKSHVLYNFNDASSLNLSGISVPGSILAPGAHVNFSNGSIDGTLITNSMSGSGTFNYTAFQGAIPTVIPEPSGVALIAASGMLALFRRRR